MTNFNYKKRCSGYGVFPDGSVCRGCADCGGRFVKNPASKKQLKKILEQNHTTLTVSGKKVNLVKK